MPKDEFDFEDPLELNGVAFMTQEDTTDAMCECFIEEFMRMRYGPEQILALFRNPNYLGMNMVLEKRGEQFIRDCISETFARWGRVATWPTQCSSRREEAPTPPMQSATIALDDSATDPMGAAIPKLHL